MRRVILLGTICLFGCAPAGAPDGGADAGPADGGASDAGPTDGGPVAGAAGWCARWADAWCGAVARCLPAGSAWNETTCRASVARDCPAGAPAQAAVEAGRLGWDEAAASACVSGLATLSCSAFVESVRSSSTAPVQDCARALVGKAPVQAACFLGVECAEGLRCAFGAQCPGRCVAWAGVGADCGDTVPCDPAAQCVEGRCRALPAAPGAACPAGACAAPLACNPTTAVCQPLVPPGGACGLDTAPCFPGLVCVPGAGGAAVCVPPRAAGQTCFDDSQCGTDGSGAPLVCAGGTCRVPPAAGSPCENYRCRDAWCDATKLPPTCTAFPGAGQTCLNGAVCAPGLYCKGSTCAHKLAAGAACAQAAECADGRCVAGRCVAAGAPPCEP